MENRYLFRGKRTDNGEWVEGSVITGVFFRLGQDVPYILCPDKADYDCFEDFTEENGIFEIDTSTICQCTGMPDKNRKIAYEHDIIKTPVWNAKIIWNCSPSPIDNHINVGFEVVFLDAIANDNYRHDLGYWIGKSEVIGSVFDNPELLEVVE